MRHRAEQYVGVVSVKRQTFVVDVSFSLRPIHARHQETVTSFLETSFLDVNPHDVIKLTCVRETR